MTSWIRHIVTAVLVTSSLSLTYFGVARTLDDSLELGFRNPPESAKPRTWWHWTASNVTKDGITKDLEWMKRVGIGGFQLADVNAGGGQSVEKKVIFGTSEWLDAVRHAASEAERLGLEMTIFSSPGWSETGGPRGKTEHGRKKTCLRENLPPGPPPIFGKTPPPPTQTRSRPQLP